MNPSTDRPLRVMQVIARLNVGGAAMHAVMLAEGLPRSDFESVLVSGMIEAGEGDMAYFAEQHGVTPLFVPELGRSLHPVKDLVTLWRVWHLMRQFKPDVVHTHSAKAGFIGRLAAWLLRVPVIVHTFHGHTFRGYFSPKQTRFFLALERWTARMSDTIITLTDGLKRELVDEFHIAPADQFTVIPLGFDLQVFADYPRHKGRFRAAWGIPEAAPLVGIVGRLVPIKNHALFLAAAAQVRQQIPEVRFVIIGDGELRQEVEAQVDALGLRDCLLISGFQRDMPPIYADLDVSVISSLNEGTPVTLIESLAAGCPVVSTAVGGVSDLLEGGKFGALVPSEDAAALAAALVEALRHPPDVTTAQQTMLARYSVARLVRDMDGLYRRLLARKSC